MQSDQAELISLPLSSRDSDTSVVSEFGRALAYSALQEPMIAVAQLIDHVPGFDLEKRCHFMDSPEAATFGSAKWHAQSIGSVIGKLAPILLCQTAANSALREGETLLSKRCTIGLSLRQAAVTGFIADAVFRPTAGQENWLSDRMLNGALGSLKFTTMAGTSLAIGTFAKCNLLKGTAGESLLTNVFVSGALGGFTGGVLSSQMELLLNEHQLMSNQQLWENGYAGALTGAFLGAANKPFSNFNNQRSVESVNKRLDPSIAAQGSDQLSLDKVITSNHAHLQPQQLEVLQLSARSLAVELKRTGLNPAEFFGANFDASSFLKARSHLLREGAIEEGAGEAAVSRPAAALTSIFGSRWRVWLDQMAAAGSQRIDAASALPLRPAAMSKGLAEYLIERSEPTTYCAKNFDHNDVVGLLGDIAHKWNSVKAADLALSIDDLAFQLTEGSSRDAFRAQRDKLVVFKTDGILQGFHKGAEIFTQGEILASTKNDRAGSLCFKCEGTEAQVVLLGVEAKYRQLGIAQSLLSKMESVISPDATSVSLFVASDNYAAINLYSRVGYKGDANSSGSTKSAFKMTKLLRDGKY
jgi:ribosomal protein S18 acetylase RimI-like enzyme